MSKKERLQRRVKRIDDRFIQKVKKGKKGTDMDIANHEARIQRLADKGGFSAPFMAKSPLNHCSSDIMHSKTWNEMRKRSESPLPSHGNRFRKKAMRLSEKTEQGDYDYENPKVTKLLDKARKADESHNRDPRDEVMREEDMSREANEDISPLSLDIGDEGGMYDEFGYGYVSTAPHFQRLQDDLVKAAGIVVSSIEPGEMQQARADKRDKRSKRMKARGKDTTDFDTKTKEIEQKGKDIAAKAKEADTTTLTKKCIDNGYAGYDSVSGTCI